MTAPDDHARSLLLEAFRREGIAYPADRLDDAVEDFSHLLGLLALIRNELHSTRERTDD